MTIRFLRPNSAPPREGNWSASMDAWQRGSGRQRKATGKMQTFWAPIFGHPKESTGAATALVTNVGLALSATSPCLWGPMCSRSGIFMNFPFLFIKLVLGYILIILDIEQFNLFNIIFWWFENGNIPDIPQLVIFPEISALLAPWLSHAPWIHRSVTRTSSPWWCRSRRELSSPWPSRAVHCMQISGTSAHLRRTAQPGMLHLVHCGHQWSTLERRCNMM